MWFYAKNGEQQGPVESDVIRERLKNGEISNGTLVWKEGMAQWSPLGEVLELREPVPVDATTDGAPTSGGSASGEPNSEAAVTSPADSEGAAAAPSSVAPATEPAVQKEPLQAPTLVPPVQQNGMAIASLILGICGFFSCGFTGLIGIPLGHIARKKIRNSPTPQGGDGMALAGLIMSYLGAVMFVFFIIAMVVSIVMEAQNPTATAFP